MKIKGVYVGGRGGERESGRERERAGERERERERQKAGVRDAQGD